MRDEAIYKLHVYWGDGKGKTTAAMGLALRALGHGNRVLIAQFMKNGDSGELKAFQSFPQAIVMSAPPMNGFTFQMSEEKLRQTRARQTAFAKEARNAITEQQPDMIILDELGIALSTGMVEEESARALIQEALLHGETAVTGYSAPDWLLNMADYESQIVMRKHPYETERLPARKGVEW